MLDLILHGSAVALFGKPPVMFGDEARVGIERRKRRSLVRGFGAEAVHRTVLPPSIFQLDGDVSC
jgi:hypothetical protein